MVMQYIYAHEVFASVDRMNYLHDESNLLMMLCYVNYCNMHIYDELSSIQI